VKALAAAAAEGDRSESADYIYRKKSSAASIGTFAICKNACLIRTLLENNLAVTPFISVQLSNCPMTWEKSHPANRRAG